MTPCEQLLAKWRHQRDMGTPKPAIRGRARWEKARKKSRAGLIYDRYELWSPGGQRMKV